MAGLLDDSGFGGLLGNPLFNMGLGVLAASGRPGATFGGAVGQGGLLGMQNLQQAQQAQALNAYRQSQMQEAQRKAALQQQQQAYVANAIKGLSPDQQALALAAPDKFFGARAESMFPKPPTGMVAGPDGKLVYDPEYLRGQEEIRRAGKPDTTVKIENQLGGGLAGNVKDIVEGTRQGALGAVDTLNTTSRIRDAIAAGNVNLGPGASLQQGWDQVANKLGISGATTDERLANTRQVMKGLAEMTLNARKSLKGQGQVSDYEGRLLQRAASGEIDTFTMPEIKAFLDVTDRLAGKQYAMHGANLTRMNGNPDLKGLAPFYEVPPLPQYTPAAPQANADPLGLFK